MKMKNIVWLSVGALMLSGCYYFNPADRAEERADRLAQKKAFYGCQFVDDNTSYRNCVIETIQRSTPKTYTTAENSNGQAIAIIKSTTPCDGPCSAGQAQVKTEITRTVKTLPAETTKTVSEPKPATQVVVETVETVEIPTPAVVIEDIPQTPKEESWWENYQKNKKADTTEPVKCPCEDPNDPCPQCVDK